MNTKKRTTTEHFKPKFRRDVKWKRMSELFFYDHNKNVRATKRKQRKIKMKFFYGQYKMIICLKIKQCSCAQSSFNSYLFHVLYKLTKSSDITNSVEKFPCNFAVGFQEKCPRW